MTNSISVRTASVRSVKSLGRGMQQCEISIEDYREDSLAINYTYLTGSLEKGDQILINTTAVDMGLGSGGFHFVMWGPKMQGHDVSHDPGHIMKLRYTPWQMRVLSVEEQDSPHHNCLKSSESINGTAVVCLELHSQVLPVLAAIKARDEQLKVSYVMTDGGALPITMSSVIARAQQLGWIDYTLTAGHCFGGQWEAVNVYSALLASCHALDVDIVVVSIGPGIVGTGTQFGHSGLQQAQAINAVSSLGGIPIMPLRFSWQDERERHRGLSHHSITILKRAVMGNVYLPVPSDGPDLACWREVNKADLGSFARVVSELGAPGLDLLEDNMKSDENKHLLSYMGCSMHDELDYFLTASASGRYAATLSSRRDDV